MIEYRHCGRKYTEFPKNKYKQIECAGCGASQFINDSSKPQYGYEIDVERHRLVRYAITGGSIGVHRGNYYDFSGYGVQPEEYQEEVAQGLGHGVLFG